MDLSTAYSTLLSDIFAAESLVLVTLFGLIEGRAPEASAPLDQAHVEGWQWGLLFRQRP